MIHYVCYFPGCFGECGVLPEYVPVAIDTDNYISNKTILSTHKFMKILERLSGTCMPLYVYYAQLITS